MKRDREKLAERRRLAVQKIRDGASIHDVAAEVGASIRSVQRWVQAHREGGDAALKPRRLRGRPRRLNQGERLRLYDLLRSGPKTCGINYWKWNAELIQKMIEFEFGVSYHVNSITRVLDGIGLSVRRLNAERPWWRPST